ncbi:hypothetical protein D3C86_2125650 [compost metagenome]
MCNGGILAVRSALPSFVQTTKAPVSAIAKFAPVKPACASKNLGRALFRIASVNCVGSSSSGFVPIVLAKSSATSAVVL